MKKICAVIVGLSLLMTACGNEPKDVIDNNDLQQHVVNKNADTDKEVTPSFIGKISEILDNGETLVEVINSNNNFNENETVNIGSTGDALYIAGTNVKITYDDFIKETLPAQIVPVSIDLLNNQAGYKKLEEVPFAYSAEDAIKDGCVVMTHEDIFNIQVLESFLKDVQAGNSSFVRNINFTLEGDLIINDVKYIAKENKFYVSHDNTRDRLSKKENRYVKNWEYDELRTENRENETDVFLERDNKSLCIATFDTDKLEK